MTIRRTMTADVAAAHAVSKQTHLTNILQTEESTMSSKGSANEIASLFTQEERYLAFPARHAELEDFWVSSQKAVWFEGKFDFSLDVPGFLAAPAAYRHGLKLTIAFFAVADGWVADNIATNFHEEISSAEGRSYLSMQNLIEHVHMRTYHKAAIAFLDPSERDSYFKPVRSGRFPSIRAKAAFASEFMTKDVPFLERLAAWSFVEGLFFQSSFAFIFFVRTLPGDKSFCQKFAAANEEILRDEWAHCRFNAALMRCEAIDRMSALRRSGVSFPQKELEAMVGLPSESRIREIARQAVQVEKTFARDVLGEGFPGMTIGMMDQHIEAVADGVLELFGLAPEFKVTTPFASMDNLSTSKKTNFHERAVVEYTHHASLGDDGVDAATLKRRI